MAIFNSTCHKSFLLLAFLLGFSSLFAQPKLILPLGHTGPVTAAQFSPDGKRIASVSRAGNLKIWESSTGVLLQDLETGLSPTSHIMYLSAGLVSTISKLDGVTVVTDVNSGEPVIEVEASICFSGDTKKSFTSSGDSVAVIMDLPTKKVLANLEQKTGFVKFCEFSPDGGLLVTANNSTCQLWNAENGRLLKDFSTDTITYVTATFSPDGQKLLVTHLSGNIDIWNTKTYLNELHITANEGFLFYGAFSPDGNSFATAGSGGIDLWNASTGVLASHFSLKNDYDFSSSADFSMDGKRLLGACSDGIVRLWDVDSKKELKELKGHVAETNDGQFSPDGKMFATASADNTAKIWDVSTGRLMKVLKGHTDEVMSVNFSTDDKHLVTTSFDSTVKRWDLSTGSILQDIKMDDARSGQFYSAAKTLLVCLNDYVYLFSEGAKKPYLTISAEENYIFYCAAYSPDQSKLVVASSDSSVRIYNSETGSLEARYMGHDLNTYTASISPDGTTVISGDEEGNLHLWGIKTQKLLHIFSGENSRVEKAKFSPDGKRIVRLCSDGLVSVFATHDYSLLGEYHAYDYESFISEDKIYDYNWQRHTTLANIDNELRVCWYGIDKSDERGDSIANNLLYRFVCVDTSDYFITAGEYYMATRNAAKLLHYTTPDLQVISFDQLDVRYNRPDRILEIIGSDDTLLAQSYYRAYIKRQRKLNIDPTMYYSGISLPQVSILNRHKINYEQHADELALNIGGVDDNSNLDRINIWINEVPVYGGRGLSIINRYAKTFDSTILLKLSHGLNKIEASVTNTDGVESYRVQLLVNYNPAVIPKSRTWFVGIGVDIYADSIHNLQYSVKDIRDLAIAFKNKYGAFIEIDTLFNEKVSVDSIKALKLKLQESGINDRVFVAYSGHGLLSDSLDYYLATPDINFQQPALRGLPYEELENLLENIPARRKLLLIDACHSGEVDKEDLVAIEAVPDTLQLKKGVTPVAYHSNSHLGLKNSYELMQELFLNVGKNTGATIISASAGTQFALERNDLKNGVFTFAILETIKNNANLTISQLKKIVGERVSELTKGLQKPTSRNETIAVDWNLW